MTEGSEQVDVGEAPLGGEGASKDCGAVQQVMADVRVLVAQRMGQWFSGATCVSGRSLWWRSMSSVTATGRARASGVVWGAPEIVVITQVGGDSKARSRSTRLSRRPCAQRSPSAAWACRGRWLPPHLVFLRGYWQS